MGLATGDNGTMDRSIQSRRVTSILVAIALGMLVGCSKKSTEVPVAEGGAPASGNAVEAKPLEKAGREIIPGENAVKEALVQKDYSAAVDRYTSLKQAVATPEQSDEYQSLYGQLRSELEDAARTNAKAAEALAMFRLLRNGR